MFTLQVRNYVASLVHCDDSISAITSKSCDIMLVYTAVTYYTSDEGPSYHFKNINISKLSLIDS